MAITQTITPLPAAPDPSMSEEDFDATATEFTAALPPLVTEINALADQIEAEAANAASSATSAAASKNAAETSATAAAASATTATTKATAAATSEANALASKNAAATSAANAANAATTAAAVGTIIFYPKSTPPIGFFKANGAEASRSAYAALFAVIGTTFGAGNGSTTFNLPDLRGVFLRGWDDASGVDSGRVLGSVQADAIKSHVHGTLRAADTAGTGLYPVTTTMGSTSPVVGGDTSTNTGAGTETRPRNVALLACIRY